MKNQTPSELFGGPQDDPKNMEQLAKEISLLSDDQFEANCNILMNVFYKSAPTGRGKIIQRGEKVRKHEESDLHLSFCKWVKLQYPHLQFIRHERESKRSPFMQNLFRIYNSDNDKMPDFELLHPSGRYHRLYIEFKKPGTKITLRDGKTIKPEYKDQYKRHIQFWCEESCAYFCDDLLIAMELLKAYLSENPVEMQNYYMD